MSQTDTALPVADLGLIENLVMHYRGFHALMAGVKVGVFDALDAGPRSAEIVAEEIEGDRRVTEILLDALAALGLLEKHGGRYGNSPLAERFLKRNSLASLASNIEYQQLLAEPWARLPETVRTGHPVVSLPRLLGDHPDFVDRYILGMADISRRPARELAERLDLRNVRGVLDVGGGSGVYAESLAERNPETRVTLLDLPSTLNVARQRLVDSECVERIELREGDYHTADFGKAEFDLVLLSHVLHDEGEEENKRLLGKALRACRGGGSVVIHDFMPRPDHAGPVFPVLFSLHMAIYTQKGRAYSADEYEAWLRECGWRNPRRMAICADRATATTAIVASKP